MLASPAPLAAVRDPGLPVPPEGARDGSPVYESYRQAVERSVADDVPFEPLARAIDETEALAADQRAALWLLAWALIGPDTTVTR